MKRLGERLHLRYPVKYSGRYEVSLGRRRRGLRRTTDDSLHSIDLPPRETRLFGLYHGHTITVMGLIVTTL